MKATSSICTKGLRKRNKFTPAQRLQKFYHTLRKEKKAEAEETLKKLLMGGATPYPANQAQPEVRAVEDDRGKGISFLRWMALLMLVVLVGIALMLFAPDLVWWTLAVAVLGGMYLFVSEDIAYRYKHYKFF